MKDSRPAPQSPGSAGSEAGEVSFEILRDSGQLRRLEPTWRWLWERSSPRPPMLEFSWVREWWRLHGHEGSPFVVVARRDERPVGLAPLYVRHRGRSRRGMLRTVCFLGSGEREAEELYSSANCWVGPPSHRQTVTEATATALRAHAGAWDRLSLVNIGPDDGLPQALVEMLGASLGAVETRRAISYRARVAPLEEYVASLQSANHRSSLRRTLRKGEAAGIELVRAQSAAEARRMFDDLVVLHQEQWQERGEAGACSSPVFRSFHERVIDTYFAEGRLWMTGLRLDGKWLALHYDIKAGDHLYLYLTAVSPESGRRYAAGNLLCMRVIERAAREGLVAFDLLPGTTEYKRRIANESVEMVTLDALGRTAAARLWRGLRGVRDRLRGNRAVAAQAVDASPG